jgi:hypothetical protein
MMHCLLENLRSNRRLPDRSIPISRNTFTHPNHRWCGDEARPGSAAQHDAELATNVFASL